MGYKDPFPFHHVIIEPGTSLGPYIPTMDEIQFTEFLVEAGCADSASANDTPAFELSLTRPSRTERFASSVRTGNSFSCPTKPGAKPLDAQMNIF
ncbi:hypothetical protein VKT23_009245 [Stygiomarasmius scandens]|uniref:Uncharacterized protein n=1 Tax=Marasmiellus scandens TaxID=2682957 RepID=A0ABR1JFV0_9AGAR